MVRKYFSIAEADALLPTISPLARQAQELKERLERHEQAAIRRQITTDGETEVFIEGLESCDVERQELFERFYAVVETIETNGCILRDIDAGIVEFYTRFEGRDVFFSWKLGERRVRFWREDDENAARRRIVEF